MVQGRKELRALVVDDRPAGMRYNIQRLEQMGFKVDVVKSAGAARKKLKQRGPFNLALVDKNLAIGVADKELFRRAQRDKEKYGGSVELVRDIQRETPQTYLAVVSGEGGPAKGTTVMFIPRADSTRQIMELAEQVKTNPWQTRKRSGVPIEMAFRKILVIEAGAKIHTFNYVEGNPLPDKANALIQTGKVMILSTEEALAHPKVNDKLKGQLHDQLVREREFAQHSIERTRELRSSRTPKPTRKPPHRRRPR
ncbi:MAG: hypothetical protein QGI60_04500 [archaeon]|jgi:CheY-like chemotaxis protein|nr:hypothetical protein [archaeon]